MLFKKKSVTLIAFLLCTFIAKLLSALGKIMHFRTFNYLLYICSIFMCLPVSMVRVFSREEKCGFG